MKRFKGILRNAVKAKAERLVLALGDYPTINAQGKTQKYTSDAMIDEDFLESLYDFLFVDVAQDLKQGRPVQGALEVPGVGEIHLIGRLEPERYIEFFFPPNGKKFFEKRWQDIHMRVEPEAFQEGAQVQDSMTTNINERSALQPVADSSMAQDEAAAQVALPLAGISSQGEKGAAAPLAPTIAPAMAESPDQGQNSAPDARLNSEQLDAFDGFELAPVGKEVSVANLLQEFPQTLQGQTQFQAKGRSAMPGAMAPAPELGSQDAPEDDNEHDADFASGVLPPPIPLEELGNGIVPSLADGFQIANIDRKGLADESDHLGDMGQDDELQALNPDYGSAPVGSNDAQGRAQTDSLDPVFGIKVPSHFDGILGQVASEAEPVEHGNDQVDGTNEEGFDPVTPMALEVPLPQMERSLDTLDSQDPEKRTWISDVDDNVQETSPSSQRPTPMARKPQAVQRIVYGPLGGTVFSGADREIDDHLREMVKLGASDMHLAVGEPIVLRIDGEIVRNQGQPLTPTAMEKLLDPIMPPPNRIEFVDISDTDFAYEIEQTGRFRVNIFRNRNGVGAVFRYIPSKIVGAEKLGLPKSILQFCRLTKGLVLVTGPTGSGKSTTLAAMVDVINQNRAEHILTIEDPIEFVHKPARCIINQREVHTHTTNFSRALRAALREDPDIVLIGEMRDLETVAIAIETAETGHLVFGTLHTNTAVSTIDRIIDQFPSDQQSQIRTMLSSSLKGVVAQTLLKRKGGGRVAAHEILVTDDAVASMIRESKNHMIRNHMTTQKVSGNIMLNESLIRLVKDDHVELRDAFLKSVDKKDFIEYAKRAGLPAQQLEENYRKPA